MRVLPDTNVLVYDTVEDSEHHTIAMNMIERAGSIILPSIVIHEYVWVMLKAISVSPEIVATKVNEYANDPRSRYLLEGADTIAYALRMLHDHGANASKINDYIILAVALKSKAVLATFDTELKAHAIEKGLDTLP